MGLKLEIPKERAATPNDLLKFYIDNQAFLVGFAEKYLHRSKKFSAVDIIQIAYIRVLNRIQSGAEIYISGLKAYISTAIKNAAIDLNRKQKRHLEFFSDEENTNIADTRHSVEIQLIIKEQCQIIMRILSDLEVNIIQLVAEGHTIDEIAKATSRSPNAAKAMIHRTRKKIKKHAAAKD